MSCLIEPHQISLGVVLYEILTGTPPFTRETTSDVIAAILRSEPQPISIHAPNASLELEHIVKKALSKDREERYQVIKDLLFDLKILQRESNSSARISSAKSFSIAGEGAAKTQIVAPLKTEDLSSKRNKLWFALPALALLAALLFWYLKLREPEPPFSGSIALQKESWKSELGENDLSGARFSPDGKLIAYVAQKNGKSAILVKQIGGIKPFLPKQDDSDDWSPIFSPGGRIAYCSERSGQSGIWETPAFGGSPVLLTSLDARCQSLIHWAKDSATIYFEMKNNLYALDITSKQITQLTNLDTSQFIQRHFSLAPGEFETITEMRDFPA